MKSKKFTVVFFVVALVISSINLSTYVGAAPRVAIQIAMSNSADASNLVDANDIISASVTWKGILASAGEPITLQATNGAEILVSAPEDVTFKANGNPAAVGPVERSTDGDTVRFISAPPASSPLENEITFQIKAPSRAVKFNLSAKIGNAETPNNPLTNFVEKELAVQSTIYCCNGNTQCPDGEG